MLGNRNRSLFAIVALTVVLAIGSTSWASIIFQGGGWQISAGDDVASAVTVVQDDGASGALVVEIFKNFIQPIGQAGEMPSIVMSFQQIAPDAQAASKIVINDESIYNGTGATWTDFHWILGQSGDASFNQDETFPAFRAGFSIVPFTGHEWSQSDGSQTLSIFGGTLASGDTFSPGFVGELAIDVNLNADGERAGGFFTLKEIPTIPEPVTMSLLAIGGLCMAMRRKS